ncbi:MAG: hypothetical protein AAFY20_04015 [Cyanobacteria bacterium J06639_14]
MTHSTDRRPTVWFCERLRLSDMVVGGAKGTGLGTEIDSGVDTPG